MAKSKKSPIVTPKQKKNEVSDATTPSSLRSKKAPIAKVGSKNSSAKKNAPKGPKHGKVNKTNSVKKTKKPEVAKPEPAVTSARSPKKRKAKEDVLPARPVSSVSEKKRSKKYVSRKSKDHVESEDDGLVFFAPVLDPKTKKAELKPLQPVEPDPNLVGKFATAMASESENSEDEEDWGSNSGVSDDAQEKEPIVKERRKKRLKKPKKSLKKLTTDSSGSSCRTPTEQPKKSLKKRASDSSGSSSTPPTLKTKGAKEVQEKLLPKSVVPIPEEKLLNNLRLSLMALKELADVDASSRRSSGQKEPLPLDDEELGRGIRLQITAFKPVRNNHLMKIDLPHPFRDPSSTAEVCLIVKDLQRGFRPDHENSLRHFQDFLAEKGIDFIKQVIPLRQLKAEFNHPRLMSSLASRFDFFLVDVRINHRISKILGKHFYRARKLPIHVDLTRRDAKEQMLRAIQRTYLAIKERMGCSAVLVGMSNQPTKHILENAQRVLDCLRTEFPGGWDNIRNIQVRREGVKLSGPVYYSLASGNKVHVVDFREREKPLVVGEVSTVTNGLVAIKPEGEVFVVKEPKKEKKEDDDEEDSD